MLGLCYLCAFASLWPQLLGLLGQRGLAPAAELLEALRQSPLLPGAARYLRVPSLLWLSASDTSLLWCCGAGIVASLLIIGNRLTAPALLLAYLLYLSLVNVGRDFFAFQWDSLLLETGLLALFLVPLRRPLLAPGAPVPPRAALFVLWLLLFRLLFASGCVKLLSGDETWRALRALRYHFETQPLPTPLGYLAQQLPLWLKAAAEALMFLTELVVPFGIFLPARARRLACGPLVLLQGGIALTGNYGFFNLLTVALCVLLLRDEDLARWLPRRALPPEVAVGPGRAHRLVAALLCVLYVPLAGRVLVGLFVSRPALPGESLARALLPFHLGGHYGLFATMTTQRPEIIIEGSDDGQRWLPYELPYQPGDVAARPRFVAPHMPRLDWQLWFAALGDAEDNPWFGRLCLRLLQGSPEVQWLFARDPFPRHPPRYLRALRYDYRFTTLAEHRQSGAYWKRTEVGPYVPVLSLR